MVSAHSASVMQASPGTVVDVLELVEVVVLGGRVVEVVVVDEVDVVVVVRTVLEVVDDVDVMDVVVVDDVDVVVVAGGLVVDVVDEVDEVETEVEVVVGRRVDEVVDVDVVVGGSVVDVVARVEVVVVRAGIVSSFESVLSAAAVYEVTANPYAIAASRPATVTLMLPSMPMAGSPASRNGPNGVPMGRT